MFQYALGLLAHLRRWLDPPGTHPWPTEPQEVGQVSVKRESKGRELIGEVRPSPIVHWQDLARMFAAQRLYGGSPAPTAVLKPGCSCSKSRRAVDGHVGRNLQALKSHKYPHSNKHGMVPLETGFIHKCSTSMFFGECLQL